MLGTLQSQYAAVKGFILPILFVILATVFGSSFIARNAESCRKAKARGEKCQSIWSSDGKGKK